MAHGFKRMKGYLLDSAVETRCRDLIKLKFKGNVDKNATIKLGDIYPPIVELN